MPFENDERMHRQSGNFFGDYLVTFVSDNEQVRADFFRRGNIVTAHTSFPTGLNPGNVTDPYIVELKDYAREHGFPDNFRVVYFVRD